MFLGAGGRPGAKRRAPSLYCPPIILLYCPDLHAAMAKLADALASGAKARKGVGVQVPLAALLLMQKYYAVTD